MEIRFSFMESEFEVATFPWKVENEKKFLEHCMPVKFLQNHWKFLRYWLHYRVNVQNIKQDVFIYKTQMTPAATKYI